MKRLLLPIMLLFALISGTVKAQTLTVCDGTTQNYYVPFYAYWGDMGNGPAGEFIYPASMLTDMASGSISAITFYNTGGDFSFTQNVRILMGTTTETTFASSSDMSEDGLTLVYEGPIAISNHQVDLSFDTPFTYSGDNLVVYVHLANGSCTTGSTTHVWYGTETESITAVYKYGSSYTGTATFLPKATFTYTAGGGSEPTVDVPDEYFYISASGWAMWAAAPATYEGPDNPDECVIDNIAITGFTSPEDGEEIDLDLVAGADNYSITLAEWYEDDTEMSAGNTFSMGFTYYMVIQVTIDDECTLADNYTVTVNGNTNIIDPAYTDYEDGVLTLLTVDYLIDENPDECIIDMVEIFDFVEPTLGGSTDLTFTYPTGDYTLAAGWFDSDVNAYTDATFAVGQYYFYVQMTPNSDDCTVEDLTYFINTDEVEPIASGISSSGDYYYFYMSYTVIDPSVTCGGFDTGFETGDFCDWTTLDADGDGFCWEMSDGTTETHNNSLFSVNSASYNNDSGNPLTPDNYLISPKTMITANKHIVSFWACAQDNGWAAEYFGLGVSTTTATASAFTMLNNWTMTAKSGVPTYGKTRGDAKVAGNWYNYTVDLSDYIGQEVYVCIRHYNCSDMFLLNIDDIELISGGSTPASDIIDFETGDLSQASFTMDATYPWTVTDADNHTEGGTYCMKSGNEGVNSSTSEMILEVSVSETKALSFWAKISSESNWDKGYFSIDGTNKINGISGSTSWTNYSYMLEAGTHTLRWYYTKDSSGASGSDCFYVDDIEITEYVEAPLFPITFESGEFPDQVIVINNDGDSKAFTIASSGAYEGTYCATVGYNGNGNDDWLIFPVTPEAGQSVSVYAKSGSATYLESFEIAVSTTTATVANFTALESFTDIPNSYEEYTADLSAYAGQDIYVAIHCISVDKLTFYVDNIDLVNAKKSILADNLRFKLDRAKTFAMNSEKKAVAGRAIKALNLGPNFNKANFWGTKANRGIVWNFDDSSMGDWTTIDADGDGYDWVLASASAGVYFVAGADVTGTGHNSSTDFMLSGSFENVGQSALTPDNYLVSPQIEITENSCNFSFWACGQDAGYAAEHFGVAVSTTSNTDASAFTTLEEWTLTAKSAANTNARKNVKGGHRGASKDQGNWYQFTVDLSDYIGQNIYVAIRHFDCTDQFLLDIDDIEMTSSDMLAGYNLYLDGTLVAEGITDLDYYMQQAEEFADGSSHTAKLEAVYESGNKLTTGPKAWTFQSGDHFTGAPNGLSVNAEGNTANLSWELPSAGMTAIDFYYDFAGGSWGDFTVLDANGDDNTWNVDDGYVYISYTDANDDYLIFPQFQLTENSTLSFYAQAQSSSWPETFNVLLSTSGTAATDFTTVIATETVSGGDDFTYDLSDYAGQTVYLAIQNVSEDMYYQYVSYITVTGVMAETSHIGAVVYRDNEIIAQLRDGETSYTDQFTGDVPNYCIRIIQNGAMEGGVYYALAEKQCVENVTPCVAPENITSTVNGTDVTVAWDGEADSYILRYRVHSDAAYYLYDFEDGIPEGFTTLDADGDGFNWYNHININDGHNHTTHSGDGIMASESYDNNGTGALNPDNWLITPQITLSGNVSFWYMGQDPSYADEHFSVYVSTTGTDTANFVQLGTETVATGEYQQFTASLAEYAGQQGYIAIRHHNVSDMFILNIDDLEIGTAPSDDEWTVVEGITDNEYLISGLLPNTTYDVQVEAVCGMAEDMFTTESDEFTCYPAANLVATVDGQSVILTWDAPNTTNTIVGYNIYSNGDLLEQVTDLGYTDDNLDYGTYFYQVTCITILPDGNECESAPVETTVEIAEPGTCETPINLTATVNGDNVTLTWEMPGQSGGEGVYTYDFEDGLNGWTTFQGDGAESTWLHSSENPGAYDYTTHAHSGEGFAMSYSFVDYDGAYQANNYLVSPVKYSIGAGAQMTFFYDFANESYPDFFAVEVSTGDDNTAGDYTEIWSTDDKKAHGGNATVRKVNGTRYDNWQEATIDLSDYAGQEIWIAFHHEDNDMYEVWIDDVTITTNAAKDGDVTFNIYRSEDGVDYELIAEGVTDLSFLDEDLENGTYYYQVVAVTDVCISDPAEVEATIVEPSACVAPYDLAATLDGNDAVLTWAYEAEAGETAVTYGFEDGTLGEWTNIDADGDGNAWYVLTTDDNIPGHNDSYGHATSASYLGAALTPDNYLVSPQVTISEENSMFSFWACGQDASWAGEHFGVAVSTTGNTDAADFTTLDEWDMTAKYNAAKAPATRAHGESKVQGTWYQYTIDLSAYMGQDIYVAIRHFNCTDMFRINVDDITFSGEVELNATFNIYRSEDGVDYELIAEGVEGLTYTDEDLDYGTYYYQVTAISETPDGEECESDPAMDVNEENDFVVVELIEPEFECVAPINIEATAADGTVILTWGMDVAGDPEDVTYDFEATTVAEGLQGWTNIDADGDGNVWEWVGYGVNQTQYANSAYEGIGYAMSASYAGSALYPDNYLVSPQIMATSTTTLSFYAEGQDPSYVAEHFGVAVSVAGNTDANDFEMITDELVAVNPWQVYTVDLSAYAGQAIYVAFRHYNCSDMFQFNIDLVTFTNVVVAGESNALFNIYRSTDGVNYELIAEGVEGMNYTDSGLSDGDYYYQVTTVAYDVDGSVGCESEPGMDANNENNYVMVTIDGIEDFSSLINIYPNPTKNNVNIEAEGLNNIVVFNALGQAVYEVRATDDHVVVNMSNFGAGVYMFNIITNNGTTVKRVTVVK